MSSFGLSIRRAGSIAAAVALMFATAIPALASAAQITERSIELSSSAATATGVSYNIEFDVGAAGAAGAVVVDFCSNSPLLGAECTAPGGFSLTSATVGGATFTKDAASTANKLVVTGTIANSTTVTVPVANVTNPSAAGALYARILTFANGTDAAAYDSEDPDNGGANPYIDDGAVAVSITNKIGVSAAVLETMTFCVSGQTNATTATNPIGAGCTGTTAPTLTLGEDIGDVKALSSTAISTGDIYTQISTNASAGAVVNLKSSVPCGGLKRANASGCDITAQGTSGTFTFGQPKFGVLVTADTDKDTALSATGEFKIASGSSYDPTNYRLNYVSGDASGITSVYGDPILDTLDAGNGDAPTQPSNKNMKLTFGASIANNTPAGLYAGDFSLIATGKF
jgi:hypothetical protein